MNARSVRTLRRGWLAALSIGAGSAHAAALGGYQFCEAAVSGPRAYVSPVFDGDGADPRPAFQRYLAERYRLGTVHARCFRLASEHEAQDFRTQRIEILHWDGWEHVVATAWSPGADAAAAGGADRD